MVAERTRKDVREGFKKKKTDFSVGDFLLL